MLQDKHSHGIGIVKAAARFSGNRSAIRTRSAAPSDVSAAGIIMRDNEGYEGITSKLMRSV